MSLYCLLLARIAPWQSRILMPLEYHLLFYRLHIVFLRRSITCIQPYLNTCLLLANKLYIIFFTPHLD